MPTYAHQFSAMGSPFSIRIDTWSTAETPDSVQRAQKLLRTLEEKTLHLEQTMSRFNTDSELMQLIRHIGEPRQVSSHLFEVLKLAQQLVHWTDGAFNPAVIADLENIGYTGAPLPAAAALDHKPGRQRHSRNFMETISKSLIVLKTPVDLGGIGKGYAADCLAALVEVSLHPYLLAGYVVDAGGDIVFSGCQDTGEAWNIGVEKPGSPNSLYAVISPRQTYAPRFAVCTSSLWRKSWIHEGRTVHHLIDPETGNPVQTSLMSVTALGEKAAIAEVVTKYVFLRGFQPAEIWTHCPIQCLWITQDEQFGMTDDIKPNVIWTDTSETE